MANNDGHFTRVRMSAGNFGKFFGKIRVALGRTPPVRPEPLSAPTRADAAAGGRIRAREMITHRFRLEEIDEAFQSAYDNPQEVTKAIVTDGS
jgi:threonine dehydrogenase-like Zn-dependent dehydrogenase